MKFTLSFKTPDVIDQLDIPEEDEDTVESISKFLSQWISYGEQIRVEFDTEKGTCRVLET